MQQPPENISKLYAKLSSVMQAVDRIPKNGYNDFHRYAYATEADVSDAIRKELANQSVAVLISTSITQVRPYTTAKGKASFLTDVEGTITFACGDTGATHTISITGTGEDSGDKGTYKAITGAVKYALMKTFLIPTGDDPEQHSGETTVSESDTRQPAAPKNTPVPNGAAGEPFTFKFGKHKGKPVTEVPDDYLQWLLEQPSKSGYEDAHAKQHTIFRAELDRRQA